MIQDIAPQKLIIGYENRREPRAGDFILPFVGKTLLTRNRGVKGSTFIPIEMYREENSRLLYLFSVDDTAYYLPPEGNLEVAGFSWHTVKELREYIGLKGAEIFVVYTAYHLAKWYAENRFCSFCGAPLEPVDDERALACSHCRRRIYPRINPAIIVGVRNGDSILLTKYARRKMSYYALVAGFAEIGETFEDTVRREVMEETGLQVKNIRYYKSQPWGVAADLLAGFYCDVDGDPTIHMDANELKCAVWMPREQVRPQSDNLALTNEMMMRFHDGKDREEI